jgi:hypothetical protein
VHRSIREVTDGDKMVHARVNHVLEILKQLRVLEILKQLRGG